VRRTGKSKERNRKKKSRKISSSKRVIGRPYLRKAGEKDKGGKVLRCRSVMRVKTANESHSRREEKKKRGVEKGDPCNKSLLQSRHGRKTLGI